MPPDSGLSHIGFYELGCRVTWALVVENKHTFGPLKSTRRKEPHMTSSPVCSPTCKVLLTLGVMSLSEELTSVQ